MNGNVAAILLAAGQSLRMGECKQLLPLGNTTVLGRCLETMVAAGIGTIVVVVSPGGQDVAEAAKAFPVRIAVNDEPAGDMASSVRTGRDAVPTAADGLLVALCDCPLVAPATIGELVRHHAAAPDRIIIPTHAGRRGHPVLFPRRVLTELAAPLTLRDLVQRCQDRVCHIAVADPGILMDMDTPADYRRICDNAITSPRSGSLSRSNTGQQQLTR